MILSLSCQHAGLKKAPPPVLGGISVIKFPEINQRGEASPERVQLPPMGWGPRMGTKRKGRKPA